MRTLRIKFFRIALLRRKEIRTLPVKIADVSGTFFITVNHAISDVKVVLHAPHPFSGSNDIHKRKEESNI